MALVDLTPHPGRHPSRPMTCHIIVIKKLTQWAFDHVPRRLGLSSSTFHVLERATTLILVPVGVFAVYSARKPPSPPHLGLVTPHLGPWLDSQIVNSTRSGSHIPAQGSRRAVYEPAMERNPGQSASSALV